jgi:hypothetical protein
VSLPPAPADATPPRRRPQRRSPWPRRVLVAAAIAAIFVLGIAIGQALNDGPPPPSTETYVRTLEPMTQQPG